MNGNTTLICCGNVSFTSTDLAAYFWELTINLAAESFAWFTMSPAHRPHNNTSSHYHQKSHAGPYECCTHHLDTGNLTTYMESVTVHTLWILAIYYFNDICMVNRNHAIKTATSFVANCHTKLILKRLQTDDQWRMTVPAPNQTKPFSTFCITRHIIVMGVDIDLSFGR